MKTSVKIGGLLAASLLVAASASAAPVVPYVQSSSGQVVTSGYNLCWRTGFWTPALAEQAGVEGAGCKCDKDILSAGACQGKAAPAAAPKAAKVTLSADMLFAFDKSNLSAQGQVALDDLVAKMAGVDLEVAVVNAYADRIGSDAYNKKLSQARANTVAQYLAKKGVAADRIQAEGRGEADPVVTCNEGKKG
ncbi:MAG: OmpA family protein, partial [Duodenibacillus sp.]|nr:OmpA family protein [Duodenibacillus sp.]